MEKKLIRITEQDLHKMIRESLNRILNEYGDTAVGQRKLGGLHARKVLRNDDLEGGRKLYDYAQDARGGDAYDNRGNNKNRLYKDYAQGYVDYLDSHPSEYVANQRRRMMKGN